MKSIYWKAARQSFSNVVIVALLSVCAVAVVDHWPVEFRGCLENTKISAANRAANCLAVIREGRLERGHAIEPMIDPARTGVIGTHLTPITSVSGHLTSKQTSVNPNFAGAIVQMLHEAGVKPGDCVAIGWSGSFPALNTCVCSAMEEMHLHPVIISSAAASQYGANFPDYLWIDMEHRLYDAGLISFRSVAASRGGYEDRAAGVTDKGRELLLAGIRRNDLPLIDCETTDESLEERMQLYREHAAGRPIRAYINVGGGTVSVGRSVGKKLYQPGLNLTATPEALQIDSVMTRFAREGVPLIHLVQIVDIAHAYGLPVAPHTTPPVGRGGFYENTRQRWMAAGFLVTIVVLLLYGRRAKRISEREAAEQALESRELPGDPQQASDQERRAA